MLAIVCLLQLCVLFDRCKNVALALRPQRAEGLAVPQVGQREAALFQHPLHIVRLVGILRKLLPEHLAGVKVVDLDGDVHPVPLRRTGVAPAAHRVRPFQHELVVRQHLPVLVGRVQVKDENTALFHEKGSLGHRPLEAGRGADVVVGVEGGHSSPDGADKLTA